MVVGKTASMQSVRPLMGGFTLIELIITLILIGILAAFAAPRFFGTHGFEERGFHDEVVFALRFAQKAAIAQRRLVCVEFPDNRTVRLRISSTYPAAACDTDLAGPDGTTPYTISATANTKYRNADVQFAAIPATVTFDPLGRPNATATLNVANHPAAITVVAETGYVQ